MGGAGVALRRSVKIICGGVYSLLLARFALAKEKVFARCEGIRLLDSCSAPEKLIGLLEAGGFSPK